MMRRKWYPKINLFHHLTNFTNSGIPNFADPRFLKQFNKDTPVKIHWWPDMQDYGELEERENFEAGFDVYSGQM